MSVSVNYFFVTENKMTLTNSFVQFLLKVGGPNRTPRNSIATFRCLNGQTLFRVPSLSSAVPSSRPSKWRRDTFSYQPHSVFVPCPSYLPPVPTFSHTHLSFIPKFPYKIRLQIYLHNNILLKTENGYN